MPMAASYARNPRAPKPSATLEDDDSSMKIWLPSSLRPCDKDLLRNSTLLSETSLSSSFKIGPGTVPIGKLIIDAERAVRLAQLEDSLDSVRRLLKKGASTKLYKRKNFRGQRVMTRTNATLQSLKRKIYDKKSRYDRAYATLSSLVYRIGDDERRNDGRCRVAYLEKVAASRREDCSDVK